MSEGGAMDGAGRRDDGAEARDDARPADGPPSVGSAALLQGHREVLIHHAGQTYRLRVTAANKLILVK